MSYIDNTFLAYAFDRPVEKPRIEHSLERVRAHYAEPYADPLTGHSHVTGAMGMALWRRDDPRLRWPHWAEGDGTIVASTNAVTGWQEVAGDVDISSAPLELGRAL